MIQLRKRSAAKGGIEPGLASLEVDALTTRPVRRCLVKSAYLAPVEHHVTAVFTASLA